MALVENGERVMIASLQELIPVQMRFYGVSPVRRRNPTAAGLG
jgi:hypothetical protein